MNMKKHALFTTLLWATLLLLSSACFAANKNVRPGVQLHLQAGYVAFDNYGLAQINDAFTWATHATYTFPFRLQIGVGYGQARTLSILDEQAVLRSFRFHLAYLLLDQKFTPYITAAIGQQWAHIEQIDNYQGLLLGADVGVQSTWNDIFSTRLGLNIDFVTIRPLDTQTQVNWVVYLGTSLHFGPYPKSKRRSRPVPVEEQEAHGLIKPQTCKDIPEGVPTDEYGCPLDFDGDTVPDYTDLCPATQSSNVDQMGCPLHHFARGVIKNVIFKPGSAHLTSGSYKYLDKIANTLKRFSQLHYTIEGHTDATGDAHENVKLSTSRATTVMNTLVRFGMPKQSISIVGYGKQYPIAPNTTKQGRALNRRIEIKWKNSQ